MDILGTGAGERLLGKAPLRTAVDQTEAPRRIANGDVVGDAELRDQRQLLEDAGDADVVGLGGRGEE